MSRDDRAPVPSRKLPSVLLAVLFLVGTATAVVVRLGDADRRWITVTVLVAAGAFALAGLNGAQPHDSCPTTNPEHHEVLP